MKIGIISDTHGLLRPEDILKAMLNAENESTPEVDDFDEDIHEPGLRFQK